jgi:hypothetical protein
MTFFFFACLFNLITLLLLFSTHIGIFLFEAIKNNGKEIPLQGFRRSLVLKNSIAKRNHCPAHAGVAYNLTLFLHSLKRKGKKISYTQLGEKKNETKI